VKRTIAVADREISLAARMVPVLREVRSLDEAINVVALLAKLVIEPDLRELVLPALSDGNARIGQVTLFAAKDWPMLSTEQTSGRTHSDDR